MKNLRAIGIVVVVIGLVLSFVAFGNYAGAMLPYQDPPPELLVKQAGEIRLAGALLGGALAIVLFGFGLVWRGWRRSKRDVLK